MQIRPSSQSAFTIVELMFAIAIGLLIVFAMIRFGRDTFFISSVLNADLGSELEVRSALQSMGPELRSAAPSNTGSYPIAVAATSSVTFFSDTVGDGLRRQIRYFLAGTTLKRGVVTPTGTPLAYTGSEVVTELVHNVANGTSTPVFDYFDSSDSGTSTPLAMPVSVAAIRLVRVTVLTSRARSLSPLSFTTSVMLRNLKDNL